MIELIFYRRNAADGQAEEFAQVLVNEKRPTRRRWSGSNVEMAKRTLTQRSPQFGGLPPDLTNIEHWRELPLAFGGSRMWIAGREMEDLP